MKKLSFIFIFSVTLLCVTPTRAEVTLTQIESYLNKLKTLQANFKQWDPNGTLTSGILYLQRPGHIRMNYHEPSQQVVLADGETIFFADRQTGDLSYTPIDQSPASFLLSKNINFQDNFVVDDFTMTENIVRLTIRKKGNADLGSLTLAFKMSPSLQLVQWIVRDAQNKEIIVNLQNITSGHKLSMGLFDSSVLMH